MKAEAEKITSAIEDIFKAFGIKKSKVTVELLPIVEGEPLQRCSWTANITAPDGKDKGMKGDFALYPDGKYVDFARLSVAVAIGMGLHPNSAIIYAVLGAVEKYQHPIKERNSIAEIMIRAVVAFYTKYEDRSKVFTMVISALHIHENIKEMTDMAIIGKGARIH
jgi:hypothetical protein